MHFFSTFSFWQSTTNRDRAALYIPFLIGVLRNSSYLFLPIVLFQVGREWSLTTQLTVIQHGWLLVGSYFFSVNLVSSLSSGLVARLVHQTGTDRSLFITWLGLALSWALLVRVSNYPGLVIVIAFIHGLAEKQLRVSLSEYRYAPLEPSSLSRQTTSQAASLGLNLGLVFLPGTAGFLITHLGMEVWGLITVVVTLLGVGLSLNYVRPVEVTPYNLTALTNYWRSQKLTVTILALSQAIFRLSYGLWPLYIFQLLGQFDQVGAWFTVALFLTLVAQLFFTAEADLVSRVATQKALTIIRGGVWLGKALTLSQWWLASLEATDHYLAEVAIVKPQLRTRTAQAKAQYQALMIDGLTAIVGVLVVSIFMVNQQLGWQVLLIATAGAVLLSRYRPT